MVKEKNHFSNTIVRAVSMAEFEPLHDLLVDYIDMMGN